MLEPELRMILLVKKMILLVKKCFKISESSNVFVA